MNRHNLWRGLAIAWFAVLILPSVTAAGRANAWNAPSWQLLAAGAWMAALAWSLLPTRAFLLLSYPLALAGVVVFTGDILYSVDMLELVSVSYTFSATEIEEAVRPHAGAAVVLCAGLLAVLLVLWRHPAALSRATKSTHLALATAGCLLGLSLHAATWQSSWPIALGAAVLESRLGVPGVGTPMVDNGRANPRNRFDTWEAGRHTAPDVSETYVFVIGESVRSDRTPGCGGRPEMRPIPMNAIVFCDVLAGSGSTHVSVPLLVGRQLPGTRQRVPSEATLLKAFEAVGFETFWLSAQERHIAWPDARNMAFESGLRDREVLLPLLKRALASSAPRKAIVLHAYNAHFPYADRYDAAGAPFPVDRSVLEGIRPTRPHLDQWWNAYDNAVDESVRFLDDVVALLRKQQGEAFLLYTADHGENMLDDARGLTLHAMKMPTYWDTAVPGIAWANERWRERQPGKWEMLASNAAAPLMHMDFAPTLLGAAGIRYSDPRKEPVDLTAARVAQRARYTHLRSGEIVTWEQLRNETGRLAAPAAQTPSSRGEAPP